MFVPRKSKKGHAPTVVSRKSVNRFIDAGLRIISANPFLYFHQTLSFPSAVTDAKAAKVVFNKFIKGVLKFYQRHELAVAYVQERRKRGGTLHFHICFLFFNPNNLPYAPSRMHRDFRTDIFNRWNALNGGRAVHIANGLTEHPFNQDTLRYFARALVVDGESTKRAETNWWGWFNKELVLNRSTAPTKQQRKAVFEDFFKKPSMRHSVDAPSPAITGPNPTAISDVQHFAQDALKPAALAIYNLRQAFGCLESDLPLPASLKPYFENIELQKDAQLLL